MKATFYQSTEVIHTPVDFNNPLHRTLVEMILTGKTPSKEANKVMKKAGFNSQISGLTNTTVWSSDLKLRAEDKSILQLPYGKRVNDVQKIEEILEYLKTF